MLKEYLKKNMGNVTPEQIKEDPGQNTARSKKLVSGEDYHLKR